MLLRDYQREHINTTTIPDPSILLDMEDVEHLDEDGDDDDDDDDDCCIVDMNDDYGDETVQQDDESMELTDNLDDLELDVCGICREPQKSLHYHVSSFHGLTMSQYKAENPVAYRSNLKFHR